MDQQMYLGLYWFDRKESEEECTGRLLRFLSLLAEFDRNFAQWFCTGKSRKDALKKCAFPQTEAASPSQMRWNRNRYDTGNRAVIENLGYTIGLWNGAVDEEDTSGLHISCGCYDSQVPNSCVLDFPPNAAVVGRMMGLREAERLFTDAVNCWDPDWGTLTCRGWRKMLNLPAGVPQLGWFTYLSNKFPVVNDVPEPGVIRRLDGGGSLLQALPEAGYPRTVKHDEAITALAAYLMSISVLKLP